MRGWWGSEMRLCTSGASVPALSHPLSPTFTHPLPSQEPCHGCELHSPSSPPHSLLHLLAAILLNLSISQNTKTKPLHHIEQRKRKLKEHSHQLWMSQDWKKIMPTQIQRAGKIPQNSRDVHTICYLRMLALDNPSQWGQCTTPSHAGCHPHLLLLLHSNILAARKNLWRKMMGPSNPVQVGYLTQRWESNSMKSEKRRGKRQLLHYSRSSSSQIVHLTITSAAPASRHSCYLYPNPPNCCHLDLELQWADKHTWRRTATLTRRQNSLPENFRLHLESPWIIKHVPEQKLIVGVKICRKFQTVSLATVSSDCPSWWFVGRTNYCRLVRLLLDYLFYRATAFHVRLKNPFFGDFTETKLQKYSVINKVSFGWLWFLGYLQAFWSLWCFCIEHFWLCEGISGWPIMRFQVPTPEFWGLDSVS